MSVNRRSKERKKSSNLVIKEQTKKERKEKPKDFHLIMHTKNQTFSLVGEKEGNSKKRVNMHKLELDVKNKIIKIFSLVKKKLFYVKTRE